ncbi:MAG TPA: hypothetical protein VF506_10575 [Streptosporangiaceae bacterium]
MFAFFAAVLLFVAFLVEIGANLGLGVLGWALLAGVAYLIHCADPRPAPWRRA